MLFNLRDRGGGNRGRPKTDYAHFKGRSKKGKFRTTKLSASPDSLGFQKKGKKPEKKGRHPSTSG